MKNNPKLEIVDAILSKVNAAIDTMGGAIYADSKKVFLDFIPNITHDDHIATLKELKKAGAIEDFENRNDSYLILHPSKSNLYEIRRSLLTTTEQKPIQTKGPIKKLELVRPKSGNKFKVVIDEDYLNPLYGDRAISSWDLLFRIAEEEFVDAESHRNAIGYFNFNKKCKLYTKTGHELTKILKVEGGYILPAIEIKVITEKAFQQRANKS